MSEDSTAQPWAKSRSPRVRSSDVLRQIDQQANHKMDAKALARSLGIKQRDEVKELQHRIKFLLREGRLIQHKHALQSTSSYFEGSLHVHPDGYGFVSVHGRNEDLYLPREETTGLIHGDRIEVAMQQRKGRQSARFVRLIEAAPTEMVARVERHGNIVLATPRSRRFPQSILIETKDMGNAQHGDWVKLSFNRYATPLKGKVIQVLGKSMDATELIELVVKEHGLPDDFPDAAIRQSRGCPVHVSIKQHQQRRDLTHLSFVTIDGENARDFDDAICVASRGEGFELWVAIADVAHYVPENSPLDQEAKERGNSFYLPDRVIPMLPETLSNGLCSLNPHEVRLAMVVRMRMDANGRCRATRIYEALIRSRARLTYTHVARWLEDHDESAIEGGNLRQMLLDAANLSRLLLQRRENRGALDLDVPEAEIHLQDGEVSDIARSSRTQAHRLIEEMMLATNIAVAETLEKHQYRLLYRTHPAPQATAIQRLNEFLAPQGLSLAMSNRHAKPRPEDWQRVLQQGDMQPWGHVLHRLMLRSMQQACYSTRNQGHFGLAYRSYTHFTSPIRRYADLTIHRQVKHMLHHQQDHSDEQLMITTAAHISAQERVAQRAEWDVRDMLSALYHCRHRGEEMLAIVSGISQRRVFFELLTTLAEASTSIDALPGRYEVDDQRHCLRSARGRVLLSLGDTVRIRIDACEPILGQINVSLIEDST